jgi:hypothetical protein
MRTVQEIQQEIREAESAQAETEFSSVGWDFYNAEITGLHRELKQATFHWDRLRLCGMLGADTHTS